MQSPILTVGEAARTLGLATETVRRMIDRGKLPAVRTESRGFRLIQRADVERLALERQAKAEARNGA